MKQTFDSQDSLFEQNKQDPPIIVAVGASAGGLEAIQALFRNMPTDSELAFVVIQHLSPDYKSLMDELLARYTKIPIRKVSDGMKIEHNTIYLIPPRKNMTVFHGKLLLKDQEHGKMLNLPIDIFFRSLAQDVGKQAIGIILSGTGSDGTLGTRAIKEAGGMIMVQDDETAKFDGMPRSSISTGLVDYILPAEEMAESLLKYIKHPFVEKKKDLEKVISKKEDGLSKILYTLRDFSGIDFSYYKQNTIIRRLERRLSINQLSNFDEYLKLLLSSDKEKGTLYRELLIGVTSFFRDGDAFQKLKTDVIPALLERPDRTILRAWVVACSTGEEAYSLGIHFLEAIEKGGENIEVKIFATDIDKDSIEFASNGFYPDSIVSDIEPYLLTKYFIRKENGYQAGETLRKTVIFATHNVLKDPPFSRMDIISCRNLFIYLKPEVQTNILSMFYFALSQGGYLFMGHSETVGDMAEAFKPIDSKWKIFKYKPGFKAPINRHIPLPKMPSLELERTKRNPFMDTIKADVIAEHVFSYFVPPSIIVDRNNNIVQVINDVNQFLRFPKGKFTNDLLKLLPDNLKVIISSMLRRVRSTNNVIIFEDVLGDFGEEDQQLNLEGRKLNYTDDDTVFTLISFVSTKRDQAQETKEVIKIDSQYREKMGELEKELQFTKENLQATVEELETSNEELQSSNEELIASNEELQSTNEELQSVNEELYTVNSEYQNKIEELTQLNNDVNNLLRNTKIGTLYLDRKLCIRKFTSSISEITNIRDIDLGRPISHISTTEKYPDLLSDIHHVLDTLQAVEKELKMSENKWYLVKIMPYRTEDNAIDGIIITLVNISFLKQTEQKEQDTRDRLKLALEAGRMAWWEYNLQTGQVLYDPRKATMLGYTEAEFPKNVYEIMKLVHPDDYEPTMQAMRDHMSGKKDLYETTYRIKRKGGGYNWYYDKGGIVERDENGAPLKITGVVIDIEDQKLHDQQMQQTERLIKRIMEHNPSACTFVNVAGKLVYANNQAETLFALDKKHITERSYTDPKWKISDTQGNPIPPEKLPFTLVKKEMKPVIGYQHYIETPEGRKLLTIDGSPVVNEQNEFEGVVFTIRSHP